MGEMAARDDLEGQGEGIMDEERDTGMAAMSRKDRREHTSGHIRRRQALWLAVFVGVEAEGLREPGSATGGKSLNVRTPFTQRWNRYGIFP